MTPSLEAQLAPVIVGQVFLHAAMAGCRMATPLLVLQHGHGELLAGGLVALFSLTQILLALPAGRFVDRNGLKWPLTLCAALSSTGLGLAALWPGVPTLWLTALLCGGAAGLAIIAMQRHVGRVAKTPLELKRAYALLAIAPAAANILGPVAVGVLIDVGGFQWAFGILAAFPLLTWALARRVHEGGRGQEPVARARSSGKTAWELFKGPGMKRLLLMNTLISACWEFHGFMVPILGHERGMTASSIGAVMGAFAVAAVGIRVLLPALVHRVREWLMITIAVAAAGAIVVVYPFAQSPLAMGICSALLGMAAGSVQPMVLSMLHRMTPEQRQGEAMAVRLIVVNAIALGIPLAMGVMAGFASASGVFWLVGGLVTAGSYAGLRLREAGDEGVDHPDAGR